MSEFQCDSSRQVLAAQIVALLLAAAFIGYAAAEIITHDAERYFVLRYNVNILVFILLRGRVC